MLHRNSRKDMIRQTIRIEEPLLLGGECLNDAISLWFALRRANDGVIPDWDQFRPFDSPKILPFVSVAKAESNCYRCILIGEEMRDRLSLRTDEKFLSTVMPLINGDDATKRFDRALSDQLPNYVEKTMGCISYGELCLPFLSKRDGCPRILTVVDFEITAVGQEW